MILLELFSLFLLLVNKREPLQTNQGSTVRHAGSLSTTYAIVNQSFVDAFPVSHEISARIQIDNQEKTLGPFVGIDKIDQRDSVYLGGRCGGGTGDERNCGTFSLTVYAEPATFET